MNFNTFPGRNDDVHGDEEYYTYIDELKNANVDDVVKTIANGGSDAYEWLKLLAQTDALYHLTIIITKGRDKPEYRELLEALKTEIEGWL